MNNKLTLQLNQEIIERAKQYAKKHNVSLSKLVENYLSRLSSEKYPREDLSPLVRDLSGILKTKEAKDPQAAEEAYKEYLNKKYE